MLGVMFNRVHAVFRLFRPRTLTRMQKSIADLSGHVREQRASAQQFQDQTAAAHRAISETLDGIRQELSIVGTRIRQEISIVGTIRKDLDALIIRETQLRAVALADLGLEGALPALDALLSKPEPIDAHIRSAIAAAVRHDSPYPYTIVDNVLPREVFNAVIKGLPPVELFAERAVNHQQLKPPFKLAPRYTRRIWRFLTSTVDRVIRPALLEKFRDPVKTWLRDYFPRIEDELLDTLRTGCFGRVLLRRRGYRIPPHRDPKWAIMTCLFYLPRPGDNERWGTQLYTVADDGEARGVSPHWIADARCTLAVDVPFRPNRLVVFMNAHGAHGAFIPEDAEPADLERWVYQVRIGPTRQAIPELIARLPEERKALWAGEATADY
jgi:hypothetical protein